MKTTHEFRSAGRHVAYGWYYGYDDMALSHAPTTADMAAVSKAIELGDVVVSEIKINKI